MAKEKDYILKSVFNGTNGVNNDNITPESAIELAKNHPLGLYLFRKFKAQKNGKLHITKRSSSKNSDIGDGETQNSKPLD